MIKYIVKKIVGSQNDRAVKKLWPVVKLINEHEAALQAQPEDVLRQKTAQWKAELAKIEDPAALAERLNEILPEAYAVVKNGCRRLCGQEIIVREHPLKWEMVPFDVQLIGGIGLHQGKIAEMATGEGKTLVATMPVYLNALTGLGVHVVTVNDYLAARDSEWMGAVYRFLGLTVGCILRDQSPAVRREMYNCDITYGTNAEFGFDYLRDNGMAMRREEQVQRGHYFAIVDEVDSILIDEARTPLIISGPSVVIAADNKYVQFKPLVESLVRAQEKLCARYLSEAQDLLKKLHPEEGANPARPEELESKIGMLLYRIKCGSPRSQEFLKMLEVAENQRLMNQAELELHSDQSKKMLYAEKEELFYAMDEKTHDADLTEKGRNYIRPADPDAFVLPDLTVKYHEIDTGPEPDPRKRLEMKTKVQTEFESKAGDIHTISQLLKAYSIYVLDVNYVVENGKVVIVDEHTGRPMYGRRWSDGLHQAVEAKEGVEVERETQTLATITIQNYFRLYKKLAGMTGTAETEAGEFLDIYKLGVLVIPTNRPVARKDSNDSVYKSRREKFSAVLKEITAIHNQGRPILVGTVSVETSEQVSKMLQKAGIIHAVLNAKYHQQEAEIVSRAGQRGAVTIATNMAGRGTDIKLGEGVAGLGGLHVIGTERHESRRIDRQLRGRCARQGDPGSSHFFISLEDDLMRLFGGSDKIVKIMEKVGMEEGQELEHFMLDKSIESAQKRVEQQNFQRRKRTLEYDDVMNKQREVIYGFRDEVINAEDVRDRLMDIMEEVVIAKIRELTLHGSDPEEWQPRPLADWVNLNFPVNMPEEEIMKAAKTGDEQPVEGSAFSGLSAAQFAVCQFICKAARDVYELKISCENPDALRSVERYTILGSVDKLWQEHLYGMDSLRESVGLRAYGQRDPLVEYQAEAFKIFEELMNNIKTEICHNIFRSASSLQAHMQFQSRIPSKTMHQEVSSFGTGQPEAKTATASSGGKNPSDMVTEATEFVAKSKAKPVRIAVKVGRNDPCPCGSGKKYKQCCGKNG